MILQSHLNNLIKITGNSFCLSSLYFSPVRNATKKAGGSVKNGRDSIGKRLGLKKSPGQRVIAGNIIIRQRGLTYAPSDDKSVGLGRDYTIYALNPGYVKFSYDLKKKRNIVSVIDIYPYKTSPKIILKQKLEKERKENAKSE